MYIYIYTRAYNHAQGYTHLKKKNFIISIIEIFSNSLLYYNHNIYIF